jgi:hypothetical protein
MAEDTQQPAEQNPLHKKLGLRPGLNAAIVAAPDGDDNPLAPLPEGATAVAQADDLTGAGEAFDYIHFFARNRADLTGQFALLRDRLAPGGSLWISWIKQSSARRGGGLPADLNENAVRRLALTSGLVDVKVASLDNEWAGLKLVYRKH